MIFLYVYEKSLTRSQVHNFIMTANLLHLLHIYFGKIIANISHTLEKANVGIVENELIFELTYVGCYRSVL